VREQGQPPQQQQQVVCLRYRCGAAPQAVQFYVWLYGDAALAQPMETWQVRWDHERAAWHVWCFGFAPLTTKDGHTPQAMLRSLGL
jgi:hypothetical protein